LGKQFRKTLFRETLHKNRNDVEAHDKDPEFKPVQSPVPPKQNKMKKEVK
jgi:hypothetical protein